jgi:hypothetical protein
MLARRLASLVFCAVVLIRADAARADDDPEAVALVARGVKLLEKRDYQGALGRFREAYDIVPSPWVAARIGFSEQGLGRWAAAETHLGEALSGATDAWIKQNRAVLEKALADVRARLGWINVIGSPVGALVRIDGETRGVLPLGRPLRLEVGDRVIQVVADGFVSWQTKVTVRPSDTVSLRTALEPLPPAAESPTPPSLPTAPTAGVTGSPLVAAGQPAVSVNDNERTVGWILLVSGLAVAGGGGILFATDQQVRGDRYLVGALMMAYGGSSAVAGTAFLIDYHRLSARIGAGHQTALFTVRGRF